MSTSNTATGYLFGAGLKNFLNKNMFVFGEVNYVMISSKDGKDNVGTTYKQKGSAMNGAVGIGYRF